jgi:hypothetical protein
LGKKNTFIKHEFFLKVIFIIRYLLKGRRREEPPFFFRKPNQFLNIINMKHFILKRSAAILCICLLTTTCTFAADITDKFTDANFLSAVRETLGKGARDAIHASDVAGVTSLNVGKKGITSLAGLEYFTSLTKLDCSHNELTSLPPLPDALTVLGCKGNQLTSLPTLPDALTVLSCYSNRLTSIALNANANYESIDVSNNNLPSTAAVTGQSIQWYTRDFYFSPQKWDTSFRIPNQF